MTDYASSDYHIGHENILKYTPRPYKTLEEMREGFVANHAHLTPEDTLYVVGDAVMGKRDINLTFFDEINCKKILVTGNHDHVHPMHKKKIQDKWMPVYKQYFNSILYGHFLTIGDYGVVMNHFPYGGDHTDDRYNAERIDAFRPVDNGRFLIHGHVHAEEIIWGERQIHVGIDADYTSYGVERYHPIPFSVIEQVIEDNS